MSAQETELRRIAANYRRLGIATTVTIIAVMVVAVGFLSVTVFLQHGQLTSLARIEFVQQQQLRAEAHIVAVQQQQIRASCQFFTDIGTAPIITPPGVAKPSRLGVQIVVDSWNSARARSCPAVPPLSPSARRWAIYYHLVP